MGIAVLILGIISLVPCSAAFYVIVCADISDYVTENDEVNNTRTDTVGFSCLDFGDAPDPSYATLLINDGASHVADGPYLGSSRDYEIDGHPSPDATGDDNNNIPDEDGVSFDTPVRPCEWADITVTTSAPGYLNAWIDFNADGDWDDPDERVFNNQYLGAGANSLSFYVPYWETVPGDTFARFRYADCELESGYDGYAPNGEVEDYRVTISIPSVIISNPVGGEAYPINKVTVMAPRIALGLALAIGGFYLVRRRVHG